MSPTSSAFLHTAWTDHDREHHGSALRIGTGTICGNDTTLLWGMMQNQTSWTFLHLCEWFTHYQLCLVTSQPLMLLILFQLGRSQVRPPALPQRPPFTWHLKWAKLPFNKLRRQQCHLGMGTARLFFELPGGVLKKSHAAFGCIFAPWTWASNSRESKFWMSLGVWKISVFKFPPFEENRMLGCLTRKRPRSRLSGMRKMIVEQFCRAGCKELLRCGSPALVKNWTTWNNFWKRLDSAFLSGAFGDMTFFIPPFYWGKTRILRKHGASRSVDRIDMKNCAHLC